jgi:hypothetical protein
MTPSLAILILAQDGTVGVFVWALLLVALVVVMFVAVSGFKRWLHHQDLEIGPAGGFTLAELRRLHREGMMSDEEFEATRRRIVAAAQAASAKTAPPVSAPRVDPKLPSAEADSDNIDDDAV